MKFANGILAFSLVVALGGCGKSPVAPNAASSGRAAISTLARLALPAGGAAADVPFKGRIDGHLDTTPTSDPTILLSVAHAAGIGTEIGAFTKVTSDVVNLATGRVTGTFTMTAESGDQLTGEYSGPFTFGAPGTFSWVLDATITGGTGRFSDATGTFVFKANVQFSGADGVYHGTYSETFDGTIGL